MTTHQPLPTWRSDRSADLENAIEEFALADSHWSFLLRDAVRRGRRLRASLALQLARWCGWAIPPDEKGRLYEALARVEFLHAASCIADDIIDGDATRRGQPSFHYRNGLSGGILTLLRIVARVVDEDARANGRLAEVVRQTLVGEAHDTGVFRVESGFEPRRALDSVLAKTMPLFEYAHEQVARACLLPTDAVAAAGTYGGLVGAYYQLTNDFHDWFLISPSERGEDSDLVLVTLCAPIALMSAAGTDAASLVGQRIPRRRLHELVEESQALGAEVALRSEIDSVRRALTAFFPGPDFPADLNAFLDIIDTTEFWNYKYD